MFLVFPSVPVIFTTEILGILSFPGILVSCWDTEPAAHPALHPGWKFWNCLPVMIPSLGSQQLLIPCSLALLLGHSSTSLLALVCSGDILMLFFLLSKCLGLSVLLRMSFGALSPAQKIFNALCPAQEVFGALCLAQDEFWCSLFFSGNVLCSLSFPGRV